LNDEGLLRLLHRNHPRAAVTTVDFFAAAAAAAVADVAVADDVVTIYGVVIVVAVIVAAVLFGAVPLWRYCYRISLAEWAAAGAKPQCGKPMVHTILVKDVVAWQQAQNVSFLERLKTEATIRWIGLVWGPPRRREAF